MREPMTNSWLPPSAFVFRKLMLGEWVLMGGSSMSHQDWRGDGLLSDAQPPQYCGYCNDARITCYGIFGSYGGGHSIQAMGGGNVYNSDCEGKVVGEG
ncbi:hypothetical protein SLE2022_095110 [Rubroshorea leprosula]